MLVRDLPKCLRIILFSLLIGEFVFQSRIISVNTVRIASKSIFETTCVDNDNIPRNDGDNWTVNCARRICYSKSQEPLSYLIHYDCPALVNVDPTNCQSVSNSSDDFPACCGVIQCTNGTLPVITNPDCYDMATDFSCAIWKALTNCTSNVDPRLDRLYNLTITYCNQTCGYCT